MFEVFPHKADVGIRGYGSTIEEAFCEAAKAMFSVMVELDDVKAIGEVNIKIDAKSLEELFVSWLNELLSEAALEKSLFNEFRAKIRKVKGVLILEGSARGEAIDVKRHRLKTEVKGATYSGLRIIGEKGNYRYNVFWMFKATYLLELNMTFCDN
ncbi:MAG: archease [Candidatus Diapherotrites archaeon]|nr:archease [Candidatus Diapherotrites archaeon]